MGGRGTLSFVNMNTEIKTTKDNAADIKLQTSYSMLMVPEMHSIERGESKAAFSELKKAVFVKPSLCASAVLGK